MFLLRPYLPHSPKVVVQWAWIGHPCLFKSCTANLNSQPRWQITGLVERHVITYYFRRTNEMLWGSRGQERFTREVTLELLIEKEISVRWGGGEK